jgi:hypothetical protein
MKNQTALLPLLAALGALGASACLKSDAKTPAVMPALVVPAPPSRTILPTPIDVEEPVPPPPNPVATAPPAAKPETPPPATRTDPPPAPRPEKPAANAAEPSSPVVQAAANAKMKELESKVVVALGEAERLLDQLKPPALSRDALDQLNTARAHVQDARAALGINNIVLANELAQKALTLARQLSK